MKTICRRFYLASFSIAALFNLLILSMIGLLTPVETPLSTAGRLAMLAGFGMASYATITWFIFTYKIWTCLPAASARTSPGRAFGYIFIPLFNFYWVFQVYWGWTRDYNQLVADQAPQLPRMPEWLGIAICLAYILNLALGLTSFIGIGSGLAVIILATIYIDKVSRRINLMANSEDSSGQPIITTRPGVKKSGLAITGFLFGLAGFLLWLAAAIPGMIMGIAGLRRINQSQGRMKGQSLTIAAIVLSIFSILAWPFFWSGLKYPPSHRGSGMVPGIQALVGLRKIGSTNHSFFKPGKQLEKNKPHPGDKPDPGEPLLSVSLQDYATELQGR